MGVWYQIWNVVFNCEMNNHPIRANEVWFLRRGPDESIAHFHATVTNRQNRRCVVENVWRYVRIKFAHMNIRDVLGPRWSVLQYER